MFLIVLTTGMAWPQSEDRGFSMVPFLERQEMKAAGASSDVVGFTRFKTPSHNMLRITPIVQRSEIYY
jgi:hypothetical protein